AADEWGFTPLRMQIDEPPAPQQGDWQLVLKPTAAAYAKGHDAAVLLRELSRLGTVEARCNISALPDFDALDPEQSYFTWDVRIQANVDEAAIREIFDFVG